MERLNRYQVANDIVSGLTIIAALSGVLWVMIEGGGLFIRYFTIQSNIIVIVVAIIHLLKPKAKWLEYASAIALVNIVITAIVFHALLQGFGLTFKNHLTHTFAPLFYVILYYGFSQNPIGIKSIWVVWVYPLAYFLFFLIFGPLINFYPYPFMDVNTLGLNTVLITGFGIFLPLIVLVSFGLIYLKRFLFHKSNH